jgi:hypothetical protein
LQYVPAERRAVAVIRSVPPASPPIIVLVAAKRDCDFPKGFAEDFQHDAWHNAKRADLPHEGRLCSCGEDPALIDCREMLSDHVPIGLEPVTVFNELTPLHRPDLHPTAALVILGR